MKFAGCSVTLLLYRLSLLRSRGMQPHPGGRASGQWLFLLCGFLLSQTLSADTFISGGDGELNEHHHMHPEIGCMHWKDEARHFHKLLPKDSVVPDDVRHEILKKGHGLAGKHKERETSVNYILKKKMFDMTVAGSPPEHTEAAVFAQCLKYEREYTFATQAGGHDPNPKLRSTDSVE
ncbi:hypothetical protein KEM63_05900 [Halopseudomonas nanhaiensis]|uniref:hypothetical protein n=1 Tax=Halopseudomonas nanhaiensis TaxID=2830842 RepID=UPI001CBBE966|nr:hypothetical protein [Halopseudomonas nanhaiensis]UAW99500.1 hypothetical protein KEM63_05900 [Halopseudomonas nanhaiensis]